MNEFKPILTKLKEIIKQQVLSDKKVMDKQVAETLGLSLPHLLLIKVKTGFPTKPY